jgi:hypothetical protein
MGWRVACVAWLVVAGCESTSLPGGEDLAGADLTGADLRGADLSGADLAGAADMAGGGCNMSCDPQFFTCCNGQCRNLQNDPDNCGKCGMVCGAGTRFCSAAKCGPVACGGQVCIGTTFCCGQFCCPIGQICCDVEGPGPSAGPRCHTPMPGESTCPLGCPACQ